MGSDAMWPKYFLGSLIILALGAAGIVISYLPLLEIDLPYLDYLWIFPKLLVIANCLAIFYLFRFGALIHSRWRRVLFFLIAAYLIVALFKIMHWPFANSLSAVPFLGIPVFYTIWFFSKPGKNLNDYMKVTWVVVNFLFAWTAFHHWRVPFGEWVTILTTLLLHFTYIHFFEQRRRSAKKEMEWDIEGAESPR